jgi:hypothetical protein
VATILFMSAFNAADHLDKLLAPDVLMANTLAINNVRNLMTIVSGTGAGVLGLTNLSGFAFFLLVHVITSLALLVKMKFQISECQPGSTVPTFIIDGLSGQVMSFMLFWTVAFSMINVY